MCSKQTAWNMSMRQWIGAAGLLAALSAGAGTAGAATLLDPPVFASQNGVLDIMMIAMPQPIPTISFVPAAQQHRHSSDRMGLPDLPASGVRADLPSRAAPPYRPMAARGSR